MDTNRIGAIAETAIAAELVQLGYDVLRPLVESRYDLAVDLGGRLIRIQCKTAPTRGERIVVRARTCRRTAGGVLHGTYSPDEVDVIAAYSPKLERCFAVPMGVFGPGGTVYLRTTPTRNGQRAGLHFAEEYTLGAIAQLEERLGGTQKVVGSSPTSSTSDPRDAGTVVVGAHEFRNRFGWYMERAAAGEPILITRRGRPHLRLSSAVPELRMAA